MLKVEVQPGEFVTAMWMGDDTADFTPLLNQDVLLEGVGAFRASGTLHHVDADVLLVASPRDSFQAAVDDLS